MEGKGTDQLPCTKSKEVECFEIIHVPPNKAAAIILYVRRRIKGFITKHKPVLLKFVALISVVLFAIYSTFALWIRIDNDSLRLAFVLAALLIWLISYLTKGWACWECFGLHFGTLKGTQIFNIFRKYPWCFSVVCLLAIFSALVIVVATDIVHYGASMQNFWSGVGFLGYILLFFITSKNPLKVNWCTVGWGIGLQCMFGLLVLRWDPGLNAFQWLGDRVSEMFSHSRPASQAVFGPNWEEHFFAFGVMSSAILMMMIIVILQQLGAIDVIVRGMGHLMSFTMQASAAEAIVAAANMFFGMTTAPLLVFPMLEDMTLSELHSVMASGYASVAVVLLPVYAAMGIPTLHLLSATIMSAPAGLALAKLSLPENKSIRYKNFQMQSSKKQNLLELIMSTCRTAISLVASIMVNIIAFLALLDFFNTMLNWFGQKVGIDDMSFQWICSYVFLPFAMAMGIEYSDAGRAASLLGVKTFLNEFVAYGELSTYINNRHTYEEHIASSGTWLADGDDILLVGTNKTLVGGTLKVRTEVLLTYGLCGFANFGSIGITLGMLSVLIPSRAHDMASLSLRSMMTGNIACFMTSCIAGLLYTESGG